MTFPRVDEVDLIRRLGEGDRGAVEAVVREYGPRMLVVAERILNDADEAQDCVQNAFLNALRAIEGFRGDAALWTWLHRIVTNEALLRIRSRRGEIKSSLDTLLPVFDRFGCRVEPTVGSMTAATADELLERKEVREFVRRAVQKLPDPYRTVLVLRDLEGFSTEETAEALQISVVNVRVRLHRARSALKKLLEPVLMDDYDL